MLSRSLPDALQGVLVEASARGCPVRLSSAKPLGTDADDQARRSCLERMRVISSRFSEPVEQAGDIGIAANHARADLLTAQTRLARAAENAQHVVLRAGQFVLREQIGE